jgi:gliding motility-associated-like protein
MKNLYILILISFLTIVNTSAQNTPTFYNNGANVFINEYALVRVNGGIENTDTSGYIQNEGLLEIANSDDLGNLTISDRSTFTGSGLYRVEQDWFNNANFIAEQSTVELYGSSSEQLISGSNISFFHNLTLSNTTNVNASRVKRQTLDSYVSNVLNINDRVLATDSFTMYVTNPDVDAVFNTVIPNNEGYVSSLAMGSLARHTNSSKIYYFPTGSSLNQERYRPIEIVPETNDFNIYTVRLVNNDASLDGYNTSWLDAITTNVNPYFYHRINRISGSTPALVNIYYNNNADGDYNGICQWDFPKKDLWNDLGSVLNTVDYPMVYNTKKSLSTFIVDDNSPFILSNNEGFFIPNVFTPNGDGVNDVFEIQHAGILLFNISVYNRWGTKMWEAGSPEIRWDGRTTAGEEASEGVYSYILKAKSKTKDYSRTGTITLIR